MEDICEELDRFTVEFFDTLECLQEKREYLNASIRDGYLNLSKARYSMGNKSVGALQYSHKMDCALYHVSLFGDISKEESENAVVTFEMEKALPRRAKGTSKTGYNEKEEEENVVRRRKPQKSGASSDEATSRIQELYISKEENLPVEDENVNGCVQDPLKWFGILVPGCLKTGQKNFQSAVELSCDIVNLEMKVKEIIEKLNVLKIRKKELSEERKKLQEIED